MSLYGLLDPCLKCNRHERAYIRDRDQVLVRLPTCEKCTPPPVKYRLEPRFVDPLYI